MAKTAAGVAMVAIFTVGAALRTDAGPNSELAVVLHVADHAHASPTDLAAAELLATPVYELAGVRVTWTDGAAATAGPDGAFHVDVVLVPNDKAARTTQSKAVAEQVFGRACRQTRRAYIFYNRLSDQAARTDVGVSRLLGMVLTHEVGHVLLGADSHFPSGIMRANWYGRIVDVPGFTAEQGTTMRSLLATASAN